MILVTGGAGYIGSHTVIVLLAAGFDVVILDNLCQGSTATLQRIEQISQKKPVFVHGDIRDAQCLNRLFKTYPIRAVMHFAGLKSVPESVRQPLQYFDHNINGSTQLFKAMLHAGVFHLVYSSSAIVYGESGYSECRESMPRGYPDNPYGYSKLVIEQMLESMAGADSRWSVANLRYFNPIGAHPSGLIGEMPQAAPNNLLPYLAKVASGKLPVLHIYGNDYPTHDGTAIRDYVHVMDVAEAHLKALYSIQSRSGNHIWNLGTGRGSSVLEVVNHFMETTGVAVPYQFAPRRAGDLTGFWANVDKAKAELGWQAQRTLKTMLADSWLWELNHERLLIGAN